MAVAGDVLETTDPARTGTGAHIITILYSGRWAGITPGQRRSIRSVMRVVNTRLLCMRMVYESYVIIRSEGIIRFVLWAVRERSVYLGRAY